MYFLNGYERDAECLGCEHPGHENRVQILQWSICQGGDNMGEKLTVEKCLKTISRTGFSFLRGN